MGQLVGRALIAGLCIAAAAAVVALASGEFGEGHVRVMGTALGFSVFGALAGAGDALRTGRTDWRSALGLATETLAVVAFLLLLIPLWIDDDDVAWRAWGIAAVLSLSATHAALVLRGARAGDTPLVRALVVTSLAAATVVAAAAVVSIAGAFDGVDEGWGRAMAATLVVLLLTTALPPLVRRLTPAPVQLTGRSPQLHAVQRTGRTPQLRGRQTGAGWPAGPTAPPGPPGWPNSPASREALAVGDLAEEVEDAADRLERAERPDDARREAAVLRALAERVRR